jgi:hypothetical protein
MQIFQIFNVAEIACTMAVRRSERMFLSRWFKDQDSRVAGESDELTFVLTSGFLKSSSASSKSSRGAPTDFDLSPLAFSHCDCSMPAHRSLRTHISFHEIPAETSSNLIIQ